MEESTTDVTAWLAFTLAFDASARHCQHLRQNNHTADDIQALLTQYRLGQTQPLTQAFASVLKPDQLSVLGSKSIQLRIEEADNWRRSHPSHHLIALNHNVYPQTLRDTPDAPALLYGKGDVAALQHPAVAMVGSRKASRSAIDLTYQLARQLAQRGIAIVSGLARGIDAAAHEGALSVGGVTIAVAATEAESVYPKKHLQLAQRITANRGLILTEYPLGASTKRWYFPRRNRIISGLSLGVLVSEAGLPSGTLTTATHAMNQGREVMAVPGAVSNPQARGCHALIKQGAALVECEADILDTLAGPLMRELSLMPPIAESDTQQSLPLDTPPQSPLEASVRESLAISPATIDELLTDVSCNISELSTLLGMLEIEGAIKSGAGGRYSLM